jgi:diamine N-acetyltransferase
VTSIWTPFGSLTVSLGTVWCNTDNKETSFVYQGKRGFFVAIIHGEWYTRPGNKNRKEIIMNNICLEKLTWDTVDDVLKLKVSKEQKEFVAPNRDSIIDAYFALTEESIPVFTFGIYLGKKPVGFLMIGYDVPWAEQYYGLPRGYYYIWRFMIDKRYQGNGYGKEALKLAIDFIKTSPSGKAEYCWLSYEPENEVARNLYLSFGFEEKKELWKEDQEIPAVYKL